jgi:pimeloyl-ACP methyl ester carboxylesterase
MQSGRRQLLESLSAGPRYIYLHDFGAPVGFEIVMRAPDQVLGLIIQNANAHDAGQGEGEAATNVSAWNKGSVALSMIALTLL